MNISIRLIVIASMIGASTTTLAQTPSEILKITADRRQQTHVVVCELAFEVQTHSRYRSASGNFQPLNPPIKYSQVRKGVVDFQGGRYRWDYSGEHYSLQKKSVQPYRAASSFDAETLRSVIYPQDGESNSKPRSAVAADFAELKGDLSKQPFQRDIEPFFLSHGVFPAAMQRPLHPGRFHSYDSFSNADTFKPSSHAGEATAGVWLETIMESTKPVESLAKYCFDPKKQHHLVRSIVTNRGKVSSSTTYRYTNNAGKLILSGWTFKTQTDGVPIETIEVTVTKIDYLNTFDESVLKLTPEPGMVVGKLNYSSPEVDTPKDPVLERFKVKEDGSLTPIEPRQSWFSRNRPWIIGTLIASITLVVILIVRIRVRNQKPMQE